MSSQTITSEGLLRWTLAAYGFLKHEHELELGGYNPKLVNGNFTVGLDPNLTSNRENTGGGRREAGGEREVKDK